ncbi:DUF5919 domain-containing protein [Micromonospora sp. NPDC048843]|uniref:DUF5919 domain-containing protein n=1 Tax=Micromonospora sp. NPDC048843 TaxID=3155389 RepID=UPI0033D7D052
MDDSVRPGQPRATRAQIGAGGGSATASREDGCASWQGRDDRRLRRARSRQRALIDDRLCVVQHYLPQMRGVDCPATVIERSTDPSGLYPIFDEMFSSLWDRSRQL